MLERYRRLLRIARKPSREEVMKAFKISAIGIALIGAIGFAMHSLFAMLR